MAAKSKIVDNADGLKLAESIKSRHTYINQEQDLIETDKVALSKISTEIFIEDLSKDEPEVLGNHEYHLGANAGVSAGTVTVCFKLNGRPFTQIGEKPAAEVVKGIFKEHSDKLFGFEKTQEILSDEAQLRSQATVHPECFDITLKQLTDAQRMELILAHPDLLSVKVTDINRYAELYPAHVKTTEYVSVKSGFLEAVAKIEPVMLKGARHFLKALLKPMLTTAVNCGNRSKKN